MDEVVLGVMENLCANCLFLPISILLTWALAIVLGLLMYNWYGRPGMWASRLFGLGKTNRIDVFAPGHNESSTEKGVMNSREIAAIEELKDSLNSAYQLPAAVEVLTQKLGARELRPTAPDLKVRLAPEGELTGPIAAAGSLLLIGGPLRNRVTKYYLDHFETWLKLDQSGGESFVACVPKQKPRSIPGCNAVLEKVGFGHSVVLIAFGCGEEHTASAVKYLAENWKQLYHEFNQKDFAIALQVSEEDGRQVRVLERLSHSGG